MHPEECKTYRWQSKQKLAIFGTALFFKVSKKIAYFGLLCIWSSEVLVTTYLDIAAMGFHIWHFVVLALYIVVVQSGSLGKKPKLVANNKVDRIWKVTKHKCESTGKCSKMIADEAYNCVNECTSPACYEEVYAEVPLEDGEIDSVRSRSFTACLRKEVNASQKKKLYK